MQQTPEERRELGSIQVLVRAGLRLILMVAFAAFGNQGFATTLSTLLMLTAIYCACAGAMRREPIGGRLLTNWDEAAIHALLGHVAARLA